MQNNNKRERILDAMQELMRTASAQAISVSDIAQKAGIGKGSIYYYFPSKNNIIDAVIERSYSRVLDAGRELAASSHMDAFKKMEIRTDGEETVVRDERGTEFLTGPDFLLKVNGETVYDYPLDVEGKLILEECDRG